jgi:hypothetical protein
MLTHSSAEVVGCHPLFGSQLKDIKAKMLSYALEGETAGFLGCRKLWIKTH